MSTYQGSGTGGLPKGHRLYDVKQILELAVSLRHVIYIQNVNRSWVYHFSVENTSEHSVLRVGPI